MRHYLYVSDVKLDMYYEDIPPSTRDKIAVELKIDLKIISTTIKEKALKESRYQKLRVVERYLRTHEKVGSIEEPATWFAGTVPMRWGTIPSGSNERGDLVLFGAKLPSFSALTSDVDCYVGLVGSRNHVIGYNAGPRVSAEIVGSAAVGEVVQHLGHHLNDLDSEYQGRHRLAESSTPAGSKSDFDALQVVIQSVGKLGRECGDPQRLEFLAKRLMARPHMWQGRSREVVFGTPLYVAMSDSD